MTKVWVTENWYIPVDEWGYVDGPCFEGMLGCVLQLRSGDEDALLAMKIPRLLADTIEENAYICNMTEEEEEAVRKINTAGGNVEGLVAAQFFESNRLIKRRTTNQSNYPDARAQHDHVIFVSFEHDRKPRFCAVSFTEDGWSIFPEKCQKDFVHDVSKADWDYFIELAGGKPHLIFSQAVFRSREIKERADRGEVRDALQGRQFKVWYAAIPSMIFQWAGGNLQETITKGEIGKWSFDKHFTLFEQILKGVRYLHSHGMIHGDIRPANVMWLSSQEPDNFRLGDYGSYGKEWKAVSRPEPPGGLTLVGPAVGQRRQSPFYAPERRTGNEFESADTAIVSRIITNKQTNAYYYVLLLGWRSQLLEAGSLRPEVSELMKDWGTQAAQEEQAGIKAADRRQSKAERLQLTSQDRQRAAKESPDPDSDELYRGDRLRLRNYLFEVIRSEKKDDNRKLFLCSGRYADILHGSLVVYKESGFINDWTVIDLSNYVEFRQWSAASDLYSVGALFLYSLFCCGLQKHAEEDQTIDPDRLFVEMMEILESVPYFRFFWKELEAFRQRVEDLYHRDPQPTPQEAAGSKVGEGQTLFDMALYATNNIIQSTPKARVVLEAFDFNLAHFLLFMHFVLACLHRKSHMSEETSVRSAAETDFITPFADDRLEPPKPNGAASRAWDRLQVIQQYLDQQFFREFKCKDPAKQAKILDFDPRSDFQIRIEHEKLRMKIRSKWLIPKPRILLR
jgi:serine/threonine protein kinase